MTAREQVLKTGGPGWTTKIAAANLAARRRERPSSARVDHVVFPPAPVCTYGPPPGLPFRMWKLTRPRKAVL